MYPDGFQTWVEVTELGGVLEGEFRPGHFRGVATVVLKLLSIARPRRIHFGQKDAQQVEVIRRMIRDLALDVDLRVLPTVRDADGLALSSRNSLLSAEERKRALALSGRSRRATPTRRAACSRSRTDSRRLHRDRRFRPAGPRRCGPVGSTRLIDNVPLEGDP